MSGSCLTVVLLIDEMEGWFGSEVHILNLASHLDPGRFRPVVAVLGRAALVPELRARGLQAHEVAVRSAISPAGVAGIGRIASFLAAQRASLLVTYHTASDLLGPPAARLAGIKAISCRRDDGFTKKPIHRVLQRRVNRLLSGMIVVSRAVGEVVQRTERFPAERIEVIWNGEDLDRFSPGPSTLRTELGLASDSCVVAAVGSLSPVKDQATLIEAVARLAWRYPHIVLLLVGEGPLRQQLAAQAARLGQQVRLLGYRKDIPNVLRGSDIFVQPSLTEGFPNAVVQAMGVGLPVIATEVGGNVELVAPAGGTLVAPGRPDQLANAIERLVLDRARRRRLGAWGRRHVRSSCTLETMAARFMTVLSSVAAERPARPWALAAAPRGGPG